MGDIGKEHETVTFEPLPEHAPAPVETPVEVPAAPVEVPA